MRCLTTRPAFYQVGTAIEAAKAAGTQKVVLVGGGGVLELPSPQGGGSARRAAETIPAESASALLVSDGWASSAAQMMNPLYAQYNASHRSNYAALVSANFPSYTMLCPGFMLDQPFDAATSPPPLEREHSVSVSPARARSRTAHLYAPLHSDRLQQHRHPWPRRTGCIV